VAKQLISASKNWEGTPEIDTYIPSLQDNANIEEALQLFMYGTIDNGTGYDPKSLYNFLTTFKIGIDNNSTTIAGHTAQSNNVHNLGTAGPAGSDGGNIVGTSAQQTLTNKTLTNPVINLPASGSGLAPVGTIVMYGATAPPTGWLLCNGQSTAAYPALAAVVGATVPDLMGRSPIGWGDSLDSGITTRSTIGEKLGEETVALTSAQSGVPAHDHGVTSVGGGGHRAYGSTYNGAGAHNHTYAETSGGSNDYNNNDGINFGVDTQTGFQYNQNIGGGNHDHPTYVDVADHSHSIDVSLNTAANASAAHQNMHPSTVVNFIIKH
jgi:microcystin-dependent protein